MNRNEINSKLIIITAFVVSCVVLIPLRPITASTVAKYLIGFTVIFSIIIKFAINQDN